MIDLDDMEKFSQSMIERGIGHTETGASCYEAIELITRLRQAEKDAARYRWIKENGQLGVGRCGVDWELYFEGPAPDNSAKVERHIDEAMQCNK